MKLLTIDQINELNFNELDSYFWELYNYISNTLQHKISKEVESQFKYVSNRLKN